MMSSPLRSVPMESLSDQYQSSLGEATADIANLSLRELLGFTLTQLALAERQGFLVQRPEDKGNGSYERSLQMGSVPVMLQVPRTRSGDFRPTYLPGPYQRGYTDETKSLILGLLASSRSVNAVKQSLSKLGISASDHEVDTVAQEFIDRCNLRNKSPIPADLIALFVDGKYVEIRDGECLKPACIYVCIGLDRNGKKRLLACAVHLGRENLDDWKKVLRSLIERGLRRVLLVVQDDFTGLLPVTKGFFPQSDVQLCTVHLKRNVPLHLDKEDAQVFLDRLRSVGSAYDVTQAAKLFDDLCTDFADKSPSWIKALTRKREHYLAFIAYPIPVRPMFSTTNVVEAVNGQLERMRRNNGGYFHSDDTLKLKLGITTDALESGKWNKTATRVATALTQLNALFERRFEHELKEIER